MVQQVDWILTSAAHKGEPVLEPFLVMIDNIRERTGGKFNIQQRSFSELGYKGTEQLREVKKGAVPFASIPAGYVQADEPTVGTTWLPFLAPDFWLGRAGASAVTPLLDAVLQEKWNAKLLGHTAYPPGALFVSKEVRTLDDLKGLKIRVSGGLFFKALELSGAVGVTMPQDDVYTALQRGTVEGAMTSFSTFFNLSWNEVCKFATLVDIAPGVGVINVVNLDAWDSLPDNFKLVLIEEYWRCQDAVWDWGGTVNQKEFLPVAKEMGIKVVAPEPEMLDEWAESCRPLWEEWANQGGETTQALLKAYMEAIGRS